LPAGAAVVKIIASDTDWRGNRISSPHAIFPAALFHLLQTPNPSTFPAFLKRVFLPQNMTTDSANQEKLSVAKLSVASAVVLTGTKVVVGAMTGSLGIIAEAAHSALDLLAAVVTFVAIHMAGKPADQEHTYGHGKIENFSALVETFLLLVTCVWIAWEAVKRLLHPQPVDASIWAFAVVIFSIGIDYHRSRKLMAAAKKHNSLALEADALHFRTDIWSSTVVLAGLVCIRLAQMFPSLDFLHKADAIAALGVAIIVVAVSYRMGVSTIQGLLDRAPYGAIGNVKLIVENIPGVVDCHHVRIRHSGPDLFLDLHVSMDGSKRLDEAHALTELIEKRIQEAYPNADVTVHAEPVGK
jgi:cation diffusion facilitator family transporter